jgi:hypothetical protein
MTAMPAEEHMRVQGHGKLCIQKWHEIHYKPTPDNIEDYLNAIPNMEKILQVLEQLKENTAGPTTQE